MFKTGKTVQILFVVLFLLTMLASVTSGDTPDPKQPIKTVNFQAAEIRSVIRFLADYGQVNVVVAPTVAGNVTISLSEVTWQNALEIIGRTYDLAIVYEDSAGYIRILPSTDYRKEMTEERRYTVEQKKLADLDTRIIRINNSTAASIVDAVQSLLSERGKATADPRTNSIIMQEIPENMERVLEFVTTLDQPPRQIRISAQLLEVSSRELFELGIDWTMNGATGSTLSDGDAETNHTTTQSLERVGGAAAGSFWIKTVKDDWNLEARVSALVSEGKVRIIAHPEITTIDNSEARIQMGQKVPIKQFDQSGNTIITFEEVGTLLKVTPHITSENRILMHLLPERSTYEYDPNGVIISTSNAETNVVVMNGQTAVIGGLTTQDEVESEVGIPILKDIPFLGSLFKYVKKEVQNRDLVIFVTPTIVDDFAAADLDRP
ncbi:MAG: type IV pilus secretin PilQ [candidate division Zixibacteria bacterium]|nr:type IV pilus secretin PilQ [candidate division Zixibacteria bacterium]